MSVELVLAPGTGNEITISNKVISHNPRKVHTGLGTFSAEIAGSVEDYAEFAQRNDRINVKLDGAVEWTGYVQSLQESVRSGAVNLSADGIATRLEETRPDYASLGGQLTYTDIALDAAIRDYWGRTPFDNFTVTDQSTETVATDDQVQNADTTTELSNLLSIPDDKPLGVNSGVLERLQSSFFVEAENADNKTVASTQTGDSASSNDSYVVMNQAEHSINTSVTIDYTIPASDAQISYRYRQPTGANPPYEVLIDGEQVVSFSAGASSNTSYNWIKFSGVSNDLTAGSHSMEINVTADSSDELEIDAFVLQDGRESYTYDNSTDSNGYLSSPQSYPSAATTEFANETVSYNVTEGTINITANDTSNGQKIQLSFDGGGTYVPTNGSEDNTTSVTANSNTAGREIRGRASLDGWGTRTTASPTTKYKGQNIDTWELLASGNNLVVIDKLNLSRNHFDNLQTLHEYGDFLWVIEHDGGDVANMTVSSFQRGDETRPKPDGFDKQINQSKEVQANTYYNTIYLQGAEDAQGDRPTAEVKDQTAINNDGREISPGVLRDPDVVTEAGATFRARALLNKALANDDYVGSVTVPPSLAHPGYARPVDFGSGEKDKTVERVQYTESSGNVQAVYEFVRQKEQLAEEISNLRRDSREIGDKV